MSGLVRGNSDLISRYNLATNGSFAINQRGTFSDLAPAKVTDYISDSWYISASSVDSLSVKNDHSIGYLQFTGKGRRGQYVQVFGKEASLILSDSANGTKSLTGSCTFYNAGGVKIQAICRPRFSSGPGAIAFNNSPMFKSGEYGSATQILSQAPYTINSPAYFYFNLQADGDFNVIVSNFRELPGAFINPPDFCPVHLSEDLARCKRYYQSGVISLTALGSSNGTDYVLGQGRYPLEVEMAGTPTTTATFWPSSGVYEEGSNIDVSANYTLNFGATSPKSLSYGVRKPIGGAKPAYTTFSWTASV